MTSKGICRQDFLARVRTGLERTGPAPAIPAAPAVDESIIRLTDASADLSALFAQNAVAAGMSIHRCTAANIAQTIRPILDAASASRIALDGLDDAITESLHYGLQIGAPGRTMIDAAGGLDAQFDCDAGITSVFAAIAELGALVLSSDRLRSRGGFLIPPLHIAIVYEHQLIPDLIDLWPMVGSATPTALTIVAGPSKTADIEGILVTGVHGPRAVHIVLVAP